MKLHLKRKEKVFLEQFTRKGEKSARSITRAHVLLLLDQGERGKSIANKLRIHRDSVYNIKRRYLTAGIDAALNDKPRAGQPVKYGDKHKAEIIAYACTNPPAGRKRWTIRLLVEELRKQKNFKSINRETIRLVLKKTTPNPG